MSLDHTIDETFQEALLEHLNTLYRAAFQLTRSESDAEDLVQETVLRAVRFQGSFQPGSNMRAWLLRIQRNLFINHYRRHQRERQVLSGEGGAMVSAGLMSRDAMRGLTQPIEHADQRILMEEIQLALDELPPGQRLIIMLADVEELSYKEIAEALECPIGTVMSRLHRARGALQKRLIHQARAMGLVSEKKADVVSMNAYRKKVAK